MTELTKDPKTAFPDAKDRIVFAFELEGVPYFQFYDYSDIPCKRWDHILTFYNELAQRCTRGFLVAHTEANDNIINDNKGIKVTEMVKLNQQLKERLDFVIEPEISYKLCGAAFFDATENPYSYNHLYTLEKAKKFIKADMEDFFLSQPVKKLIPYLNSLGEDLREVCMMINAMTTIHLENISRTLSDLQKNKDSFKELQLLNHLVSTSPQLKGLVNTITA